MITIDYTITLGNMIEIASIIGGGFVIVLGMRNDISSLKASDKYIGEEMQGIQAEIKKIGDVLIKQATIDTRLLHLEQDFRDLRRGRGLIVETDDE